MAEAPYLVALALLERDGQRELPLNGRSCRPEAAPEEDPGEPGRDLALELLLDTTAEQLPILKAGWIRDGDIAVFLARLAERTKCAWTISQSKYEPIRFQRWP